MGAMVVDMIGGALVLTAILAILAAVVLVAGLIAFTDAGRVTLYLPLL